MIAVAPTARCARGSRWKDGPGRTRINRATRRDSAGPRGTLRPAFLQALPLAKSETGRPEQNVGARSQELADVGQRIEVARKQEAETRQSLAN